MARFKSYTELSGSDIERLGRWGEFGTKELRLPVRIVHPIDASSSKLLESDHSSVGSDGRTYLFFTPHA